MVLRLCNTSFDINKNNFDAVVYGKKLKIQKGRDLKTQKTKLIIFNHGGWGWDKSWGPGWASISKINIEKNLKEKKLFYG